MAQSVPTSRWYDGRLYAGTVDRLMSDLRGFVADHLPAGNRVLEACCGTGALALDLALEGRRVVGVDLSPQQVAYASERAEALDLDEDKVRFEVADVTALEVPAEGRHDVATMVLALHEMPAAARSAAVDTLTRVADRVMLVDFAAPMPRNIAGIRNRTMELVAGPEHFRSFRDYSRRGGLMGLLDERVHSVESERKIDSGTLQVVTVARSR